MYRLNLGIVKHGWNFWFVFSKFMSIVCLSKFILSHANKKSRNFIYFIFFFCHNQLDTIHKRFHIKTIIIKSCKVILTVPVLWSLNFGFTTYANFLLLSLHPNHHGVFNLGNILFFVTTHIHCFPFRALFSGNSTRRQT